MLTGRSLWAVVCGLGVLGAAAPAGANTVRFEAESLRERRFGFITSPMMIFDDPAASGGSYLAVAPGNNSPSAAPASTTEGVARYPFTVTDTGSYRIWARVSAATDGDDSFWLRIGGSASWIKWNGIPLGTAYHWVQVKADGASSPSTFSLTANASNELQLAYREDGTRVDAFIITSSTTFNPSSALTTLPDPPVMQPAVNGSTGVKVSWAVVPGATSYTLERRPGECLGQDPATGCCINDQFRTVATGLTGFKFVDPAVGGAGGGLYRVTAVAPTGASVHPVQSTDNCFPFDPGEARGFVEPFDIRTDTGAALSITSPFRFLDELAVGVPAGTDSIAAPPAHGRARMNFETAVPVVVRVWAEVGAPTNNN
jgi:hypothetical protein